MKKIIVLLCCLLLFLTGCTFKQKEKNLTSNKKFDYESIQIGDKSLPTEYGGKLISDKYISIKVYFDENTKEYLFVFEGNYITGVVVMSDKRNVVFQNNINLINFDDTIDYDKMKLEDIVNMYGETPIDICSGASCPTYMTQDGKFVTFNTPVEGDLHVRVWEAIDEMYENEVST